MRERQDGPIVNSNSIAGMRASELGVVAYGDSKFATSVLGRCVALEEGDHGIPVTNIYELKHIIFFSKISSKWFKYFH